MLPSVKRFLAVLVLPLLMACGADPIMETSQGPIYPRGYEPIQDGEFYVPGVEQRLLEEGNRQVEVLYTGPEAPGTVVVDVYARKLYYVMGGGIAKRYGIAVGREGTSFRGTGYVGRKAKWPSWTPTANMVRNKPEMYAQYAGGLPGGVTNPLGSRALYLYRGGQDTMFRIHGTIEPDSVGRATSAGCIRMFNQDVMDLYELVQVGATVKVRSLEESLALEGPQIEDAWGRAVRSTSGNANKRDQDLQELSSGASINGNNSFAARTAAAEAARVAADRAELARLQNCRAQGISPAQCPIAVVASRAFTQF